MEKVTIARPEWLDIFFDGKISHGYDQEWYQDEWQRLAGCGPTTATTLLSYVGIRDGRIDKTTISDKEDALERMNEVWNYVKPRFGGGVYKTQWMESGLRRYVEDYHLDYDVHMLNVSPFAPCRPGEEDAATFIRKAMKEDVPVAFLNRHKGHELALWTWHWVPIIGIFETEREVRCQILDEGERRDFSLTNWLKDTILGGGFAYISKK